MGKARDLSALLNASGQVPLPSKVAGVLPDANAPSGSVIQVVQGVKTDASAYSLASAGRTAIGLSATITPSSTSSKILCIVNVDVGSSGNVGPSIILKRGSTDIGIGDANGSRSRASAGAPKTQSSHEDTTSASVNFLDTPNSTSALTYSIDLFNKRFSTDTHYVNRAASWIDSVQSCTHFSSIILMEIAA